ncbi:hypothetical protein UY3_02494 [Chelonia mydas]|uniref:Uncharacterized protein n=1 Tax=Chelonia mydas TaxID=8469 RepID=M7BR26_CHEMY|nr:hypothetical protein UY3_02494 [Chelonia mydas]
MLAVLCRLQESRVAAEAVDDDGCHKNRYLYRTARRPTGWIHDTRRAELQQKWWMMTTRVSSPTAPSADSSMMSVWKKGAKRLSAVAFTEGGTTDDMYPKPPAIMFLPHQALRAQPRIPMGNGDCGNSWTQQCSVAMLATLNMQRLLGLYFSTYSQMNLALDSIRCTTEQMMWRQQQLLLRLQELQRWRKNEKTDTEQLIV